MVVVEGGRREVVCGGGVVVCGGVVVVFLTMVNETRVFIHCMSRLLIGTVPRAESPESKTPSDSCTPALDDQQLLPQTTIKKNPKRRKCVTFPLKAVAGTF